MDLGDDFDLSEFLILDEEDVYTSSCSDEPTRPVLNACLPLTPPEIPFDIDIADIKKEEESNDDLWLSTWDTVNNRTHNHPLQQPAASDTICPLSIMLSPTSSSSSTSDSIPEEIKDNEPIHLFPNLPTFPKTKTTIQIPRCHRDRTNNDDDPKVATTPPTIHRRNIRTPTSYDTTTSEYLIRIFFETYAQNKKLTKGQRNQIIQRTHLSSRKITYWFSNHKRRFKRQLETYARLSQQGAITTYSDFVQFCKENGIAGIHEQSRT
ncbi:hypothetical protein K492DRAFT_196466 [Lichtheimia hyalospora FSU 10163]|nr:hypothetical protein K492DRAFT_196466 [Lichtheimia hyalospora FSU 10163]